MLVLCAIQCYSVICMLYVILLSDQQSPDDFNRQRRQGQNATTQFIKFSSKKDVSKRQTVKADNSFCWFTNIRVGTDRDSIVTMYLTRDAGTKGAEGKTAPPLPL